MLKDDSPAAAAAAGGIKATAFRDDRGAELVVISELRFDRCRISSGASFTVGERLRLHLHGQGWIEAEVRSTGGGEALVVFLTNSRC
ncbi:MAG TPA: hypothetical protein VNS53_00610 [Sphingomicrobium sp.]|jgi:hypothetical protein|nr:hypothetical protein [Sphingomicrobium sp.]